MKTAFNRLAVVTGACLSLGLFLFIAVTPSPALPVADEQLFRMEQFPSGYGLHQGQRIGKDGSDASVYSMYVPRHFQPRGPALIVLTPPASGDSGPNGLSAEWHGVAESVGAAVAVVRQGDNPAEVIRQVYKNMREMEPQG